MKKRFTILIAALMLLTMISQPTRLWGQTRTTMTFDFEDSGAHTTTTNAYTSHTYSENGFDITCTYFDCISSSDIGGSYLARGRVAKKTTNSPILEIGPINITGWTITSITYYTKGNTNINQVFATKTNTDNDYVTQISSYSSPSSSTQKTATVSISGKTSLLLKWTGSVSSSNSSNRDFDIDNIVITYTSSGGSTVNTPQIIPNGGSFYPTQSVELSCTTDGASIYYTTDGTPPSTSSTPYSSAFTISSTCTVKAIATKSGMTDSSVAEATFTKITPYANIAALTEQTVAGTYYVTLDDAVVTFTNGNYAYIKDNSGAILYYKSGHGLSAGQILDGTATVSYKLQNNLPEITSLSGITPASGSAPDPTVVVASAWNYTFNDVLSQYIKITDATITYSNPYYYVSVGSSDKAVESFQLYGRDAASSFSISNLSDSDKYTIVGFPTLYNSTKEFQIFAVPQKEDITIESSALQLSYAANASGSMTVGYSNFTPTSVTAVLYSDAGCNTSFSGDWISITSPLTTPFTSLAYKVSVNETGANRTVYMKVSATNANSTTINKIFTITQVLHTTYSVTYKANGGTGDDVIDAGYDYNATVTVKPNNGTGSNPGFSKAGYTFQNWNTNSGGTGTSYDPADNEHNTFNITANTNLFAQWQADSHDLNVDNDIENGNISFKVNNTTATTAKTDETVTIVVTPASGYKLTPLSITVTNDDTSEPVTVSNTNTFTMPASSVTVSAEFEVYYALTIDFESALNTYSNWEFDSNISRYEYSTGSYCGINYDGSSATTSCTIATKNKIARPGTLSFYVKRTGSNTKTAVWKVYTKADNGDWTKRGSDIDATASDWTEASIDLSSYTNVYVKIAYDGNNAQYRAIDDICLEYTPTEYAVSVSNVADGTITASDGTTTITEGNSANIESAKTIILTAEGDATHMFSSWNVTETVSGDEVEVTDNTFEMPACAVTVSATFVESWTFTYNINGNVVTEKYARNNASITLPTDSEYVPEGYEIIGWTEDEGDVSSPITSATATQNRNLFAVLGKITYSDFTLVESAPSNWSGYYLIVYNNSTTLNTHSNNLDVNSYGTIADIAKYYNNKVIESNNTTVQYIVKIEQTTNGYSIYAKDGYLGYNGATSGTGGTGTYLRWDTEFTSSQNEWTIGVGSIVSCYYSSRAIRYNTSNPRFAIYATDGQAAIQLFKTTVSNEGAYTHIYPSNATATGNINVGSTGPIVIESGGVLDMSTYTLTCTDATKLIIEDGGQLITTSTGVKATVKKEIEASTAKDGEGWYTIASAVETPSIEDDTNLLTDDGEDPTYDLYRFNEKKNADKPWENYRNSDYSSSFITLEQGRGYLYRNGDDHTLSFIGALNVGTVDYAVSKTGTGDMAGLNLVGNPYSHNINLKYTTLYNGSSALDAESQLTACYTLSNEGKWDTKLGVADDIKPSQGFLIQVPADATKIRFSQSAQRDRYNNEYIQFAVENSNYSDVTYALFDKGLGLSKINHRNSAIPMIYIPQGKEDYAVAIMGDDTKAFSLNFRAMTTGKYTLSYKAKGEFSYLHVIDKFTGEDIDMLLEGEYSFIASPNDSDARFIVKLAYLPDYGEGSDDIFAFQSGSEVFVSGEGELQVFDVLGRFVMSERINGVKTVSVPAQGVYVFRLVGENVKTQKIVVR